MRRFARLAAGVLLALSALATLPAAANADATDPFTIILPRPPAPATAMPPLRPKMIWMFMTNYADLQKCNLDGQQYISSVPQDRLWRCQTNSTSHVIDLWILYSPPLF